MSQCQRYGRNWARGMEGVCIKTNGLCVHAMEKPQAGRNVKKRAQVISHVMLLHMRVRKLITPDLVISIFKKLQNVMANRFGKFRHGHLPKHTLLKKYQEICGLINISERAQNIVQLQANGKW